MLELGLASLILLIVAILLPVIAIIDLIINRKYNPEKKIFWVILILIIPYLGSVLYFLFGRK